MEFKKPKTTYKSPQMASTAEEEETYTPSKMAVTTEEMNKPRNKLCVVIQLDILKQNVEIDWTVFPHLQIQ